MKHKLIIFDLDGTLVDSIEDLTESLNYALNKCGLETYSVEQTKLMVGKGILSFLKSALGESYRDEIFDNVHAYFLEHYQNNLSNKTKCYPGIKKMLDDIDRLSSANMAVFSNKHTKFIPPILQSLCIDSYFDVYVGGDNPDGKKPSPEPVKKIMNHFNSQHSNTIMVGDMPVDIATGKAANISTCAVLWGYSDKQQLCEQNPNYVINTPEDIFKIL